MSNINIADYDFEESEFIANQKGYRHCQLFNPQSGEIGIAIKPDIAKNIGFKTDKNWSLKSVKLKDKDGKRITGEMLMSETPRMIILNGYKNALVSNEERIEAAPFLMCKKKEKQETFFDASIFEKKSFDRYMALIVFFLGKDNNLLSNEPLIFRTKGKAQVLIRDAYTEFVSSAIKEYETIFNTKLPTQTPTCKLASRFIFCPTLKAGELTGDGETSEATLVETYEKVNKDNFTDLVFPKDHPTLIHIQSFLPQIKTIAYPRTGEIKLTVDELEQLKEQGIDF